MQPIRIAIADEHALLRNGLKDFIEKDPHLIVRIEAGNGRELLEKMSRTRIDVVIIDISSPDDHGITLTQMINRDYKDTGIICLSMHDDPKIIYKVIKAGAKGYLLMTEEPKEIFTAIRNVHAGKQFFNLEISAKLVELFDKTPKDEPEKQLNPREKILIQHIFNECSDQDIALKLNLSIRRVATIKHELMEKLGVKTTIGLLKFVVQHKLV